MSRKTILVADDDKHFLAVVARWLGQYYTIVRAGDGAEALALAERERPDLLVLDVALPLLTGDEVARRAPGEPPVLFISGRDLDRVTGLAEGRYRTLTKPADLDEILDVVRELLRE